MVSLLAALLLCAGQAVAAVSTIGQLAPDPYTLEYHEGYYGPAPYYYYYPPYTTNIYHPPTALCETPQDYLQASTTSGSAYVVPAQAEEITAWSTNAAVGAGQEVTFKVFRQIEKSSSYEVVGHDGPRTLTPATSANEHGKVNTFTGLSIPVQPGDVIGLFPKNADSVHPQACMFEAGGGYMTSSPPLADSSSAPFTGAAGKRLNLTATVQLTPQAGAHTLTVTDAGGGYGSVQSSPAGIEACTSTCAHTFSDGTPITLAATPDGSSTFTGWSGGGCSGTGTCQITIGADTNVTASFGPAGSGSYSYGNEHGYGSGYGTPGGENAGGNPGAPKCKKSKASGAHRKAHCVRKTRLVARRARNATLGKELLTAANNGHTLYSLSAERGKNFICTGGCLTIWHPLKVPAGMRPIGPVTLGVVTRPEGFTQVTYHGRPLYTFAEDLAPGDVHGEGIKDVGTWGAVLVPAPKH
ncbi:MAG: hypothetical protein ACHQCF_03670 [Solirubrobacterales bacterium]